MGLNRRHFFKKTAGGLLAVTPFFSLPKDVQANLLEMNIDQVKKGRLSILQGLTTNTSTQLTVDVPVIMKLHYELVDTSNQRILSPISFKSVVRKSSSWKVDKLKFEGLELGKTYKLKVYAGNKALIDERNLQALDLNKSDVNIGTVSCCYDIFPQRKKMWGGVNRKRPDMMFFLGDNVYGDIVGYVYGPRFLWMRYLQTRRAIPFYRQRDLIPAVAIWDDHDYGNNDDDGTYKYKESSLKTFESFYAQDNVANIFEKGPGNSYCLDAFNQRFVFLDDQYFLGLAPKNRHFFWGQEQFVWAREKAMQTDKPLWFMQGSQFFGKYLGKGSIEKDSPGDLRNLTLALQKAKGPVNFASGDIHYAEYLKIEKEALGYTTHEFTTSSMHSFPPRGISAENDRTIYQNRKHNWSLFSFRKTQQGALDFSVQNLGARGKVNYEQDFSY